MIGVRYEPGYADGRVVVCSYRVTANDQPVGSVSQFAAGWWQAITPVGRIVPGEFRKRGDAGDALVEWSGILDR